MCNKGRRIRSDGVGGNAGYGVLDTPSFLEHRDRRLEILNGSPRKRFTLCVVASRMRANEIILEVLTFVVDLSVVRNTVVFGTEFNDP